MKELFDRGYFEENMRINHFRNHYEVNESKNVEQQTEIKKWLIDLVNKKRFNGEKFETFSKTS